MFGATGHKIAEHPVVIAFKAGPISSCCQSFDQGINDRTAVSATVSIVTHKHDFCIRTTIVFDKGQCVVEHGFLPVNIANRVDHFVALWLGWQVSLLPL